MKFDNLNAELVLNDKLDLLSVQLELSFQNENVELAKLFSPYFAGSKVTTRLDTPGVNKITAKVALTDEGKATIKKLVVELKDLDKAFADRTGLINEFKNLLED